MVNPPKEFVLKVRSIFKGIKKLQKQVDDVFEFGRKKGLTDKQIGDIVREEGIKAGYHPRTLQLHLPATAKGKPRGITASVAAALPDHSKVLEEEIEISANSAQNVSVPKDDESLTDNQRLEQQWKTDESQQPEQEQQKQVEDIDVEAPSTTTTDSTTATISSSQYNVNMTLLDPKVNLEEEVQRLTEENEQLKKTLKRKEAEIDLLKKKLSVVKEEQSQQQPTPQPAVNKTSSDKYADLETAQEYAREHNLTSKRIWQAASKKEDWPGYLPRTRPDLYYKTSWDVILTLAKEAATKDKTSVVVEG